MRWTFVGRTEQINQICSVLSARETGPIMIIGERGIGRSAVLRRILGRIDSRKHHIIRIKPANASPFASLRPVIPPSFSIHAASTDGIHALARAIAGPAHGRRLVIAIDDAHLADHATMLVSRDLNRRHGAVLLFTRPVAESTRYPDPTDCLRYEPGARSTVLPALNVTEVTELLTRVVGGPVHPATSAALHAASGGNPAALRELVVDGRLVDRMARQDGFWRISGARVGVGTAQGQEGPHTDRIVAAAESAWRELALDRTEALCLLAHCHGAGAKVIAPLATVLTFRGRADEALRRIDALPAESVRTDSGLVLARALGLAFARRSVDPPAEYLLGAETLPTLRERVLAYRAWLLAAGGRGAAGMDRGGHRDREAALFRHAAAAVVAIAARRATDAVGHLRRSLASADGCADTVPWMKPYLTTCLVDALLLAGRTSEASATAGELHTDRKDCSEQIGVMLAALTKPRTGAHAGSDAA